jgi:hypothetical protein
MTKRLIAAFVPIVFAAGCGTMPQGEPAPTGAPTAAAPSSAVANEAPRHCVSGPSDEVQCFATFTEAIALATGGRITDAPADARAALDDPAFADRINEPLLGGIHPDTTYVIGIDYIDANYGGNTWVWYRTTPCDGNLGTIDYSIPNLNAEPYSEYGFNDSISSFHSYANCQTVLYADWYYEGAATNGGAPIVDMSYVGNAMNDQASSIRWY